MQDLTALVRSALEEDVGPGDATTAATVDPDLRARGVITQKAPGVLYGMRVAELAFTLLDPQARAAYLIAEGTWREQGGPVMSVEGLARALLTAERTALNFLSHLSCVATMAARAARVVEGTGARVLDTRKTIPGLRALEKAAVAAGGAGNHRAGLYDAILIKENHIAAAGSLGAAVRAARSAHPRLTVEVEVENFAELDQALAAGVDRIMLDDFSIDDMRRAVGHVGGRTALEASGGVGLETLRAIAATGVDYISIGALTKHVRAIDLSMRIDTRG